jgi:hypothetical protein
VTPASRTKARVSRRDRSRQLDLLTVPPRRSRVQRHYDLARGAQALMLIDRARVGDRVTMHGARRAWIQERCGSTSTVMLGCLSCRQPVATLQQLLFHLETAPDQTHVLARQCNEHGWEAL